VLGRFGCHDLADYQAPVAGADMDCRAVGNAALEDLLGERVLQLALGTDRRKCSVVETFAAPRPARLRFLPCFPD
jgi:hypothetical protein